jgi:hypothetical protein
MNYADLDEISFDEILNDIDADELGAIVRAAARRGVSPGVAAGRQLASSLWGSESHPTNDGGSPAANLLADRVRHLCAKTGTRPLAAVNLLRETEEGRRLLSAYKAQPTSEWRGD